MSRGSPDYVGKQAFPLYGPSTLEFQEYTVDAFGFTDVFSLAGMGYILGGLIRVNCGVGITSDQAGLIIDGNSIQRRTFQVMYDYGLHKLPELPLSMLRLGADGYSASLLIGGRLTFEESLVIEYSPSSLDDRLVKTHLWYAKVT